MATSITALDTPTEVTLTSGDTLYEVSVPENARSILVSFRSNAGKVITAGGTDAAAIGTTDYISQPAGAATCYPVPGSAGRARQIDSSRRKIWLASASAGTVVEVTALVVETVGV